MCILYSIHMEYIYTCTYTTHAHIIHMHTCTYYIMHTPHSAHTHAYTHSEEVSILPVECLCSSLGSLCVSHTTHRFSVLSLYCPHPFLPLWGWYSLSHHTTASPPPPNIPKTPPGVLSEENRLPSRQRLFPAPCGWVGPNHRPSACHHCCSRRPALSHVSG